MFSGIVGEIGNIFKVHDEKNFFNLEVHVRNCTKFKIGDSVSINGVCLTASKINYTKNILTFGVVPETLQKTNLRYSIVNNPVNVESSLRFGDSVGGHMVQGHIDNIAVIEHLESIKGSLLVTIRASRYLLKYLVNKGFIAIDGMSITIVEVYDDEFTVAFVPHTISSTIVQWYKIGQKINLEVDSLSKQLHSYVGKYCALQKN